MSNRTIQQQDAPASGAYALASHHSDSAELPRAIRGIYVGGDGNIKAVMLNGDVVTFSNVVAGMVYPFSCKQIWSTGTTATLLIGLY